MITFTEARKAAEPLCGPTLPTGLQDDVDYNVFPTAPSVADLVTLVNKRTGKAHQESYWSLETRLNRMNPAQ